MGEGTCSLYVNTHSYVHDVLTLAAVSPGVVLEGSPEEANSWFTGYAWTIAYCACGVHLGWQFTAVRPGLQPASFWGLRRSALQAGGHREAAGRRGILLGGGGGGGSSDDEDAGWTTGSEGEPLSDGGSPASSGSDEDGSGGGGGGGGASPLPG